MANGSIVSPYCQDGGPHYWQDLPQGIDYRIRAADNPAIGVKNGVVGGGVQAAHPEGIAADLLPQPEVAGSRLALA